MPISSLATCRGRLGEQPISAEARSGASSSPSETRTFKRLGMASRLKSVAPRCAGHPPQSERTFGRFGRGGFPRGADESPSHRDGSRGRPVRSVRSVHPGHRGYTG